MLGYMCPSIPIFITDNVYSYKIMITLVRKFIKLKSQHIHYNLNVNNRLYSNPYVIRVVLFYKKNLYTIYIWIEVSLRIKK